jgi:hypothetical protein
MKYLVRQFWVTEVEVEADSASHASEIAVHDLEQDTCVFEYAGIEDEVILLEAV